MCFLKEQWIGMNQQSPLYNILIYEFVQQGYGETRTVTFTKHMHRIYKRVVILNPDISH